MNKINHSSLPCPTGIGAHDSVSEMISANPGFGFHSIGSDGLFIQISQTELDWLGYTREEVIGKLGFYDFLTEQDKKRFSERFPVFRETGVARDVEYNWVGKDGSIVPISVNGTAIRDKFGEFSNTVAVVINLSQRKQVESAARRVALLKQRQELHSLIEHDIKNPITSSNKLLEMIMAGGAGPISEQQKKIFSDLRYTNDRILKRMKLLVDSQRAEEHPHAEGTRMIPAKEVFAQQMPLWKVIEGCVIRVAQSEDFTEKQLSFKLDLNSSSIIVDHHAFERLISHLLENAAKFSPIKGEIGIACLREEHSFELSISDQGQGIPETLMEKLFESSEVDPGSVAGLGLFLCARITEAYGGTITCGRNGSETRVAVRIPM